MSVTTHQTGLTRAASSSRNIVKFAVIGLILFLAARMAFWAFVDYWKATHPPAPPPPTVGFGVLPPLAFPEQGQIATKQYVLETPNGRFPEFSDRAAVFFMPKTAPSLLNHEKALQLATKLGYVFPPATVDERTYRFTLTEPLVSTLDLDIQDLTMTLQTDYLNRPDLLLKTESLTKFDAISSVKKYLTTAGTLTPDVATSAGEVIYLKSSGGEVTSAAVAADAQYVEVNLNRPPVIGKYKLYTSEGDKGVIRAVVAPLKGMTDTIVYLRNAYHPIDESFFHTYPLRPVREAWNALQNGDGFIAQGAQLEKAVIRDVTLGYYEDLEGQMYLQPIYVFSGDNGFLAFVPALSSQFTAIEVEY